MSHPRPEGLSHLVDSCGSRWRRCFFCLVGAATACGSVAIAQQPSHVWRIGVLQGMPKEASIGFAAFRQQLGALGYVEGQNCIIEYRWSEQMDDLNTLTAALTKLKVDIIVAGDGTRAKVAKRATSSAPPQIRQESRAQVTFRAPRCRASLAPLSEHQEGVG